MSSSITAYIKWNNKKSDDDICPKCNEKNMKRLGRNVRLCKSCSSKFLKPKSRADKKSKVREAIKDLRALRKEEGIPLNIDYHIELITKKLEQAEKEI
jgi:ribosomal protein L37AE/L43A